MYKVCFKEFDNFQDVLDYGFVEFGIDLVDPSEVDYLDECEKQQLCYELDQLINAGYNFKKDKI